MWIKEIKITNFRNYTKEKIELNKNINVFYGENAQGKTNILEAIYICSIGKSFRNNKDKELIKFNEKKSNIEIDFEKIDRDGNIKIEIENKKNILINGIKIKKLSELLGNINTVLFTPDDINILKEGPNNRRKFLDILISQIRPNYVHIYNSYIKVLEERNNYLKKIKIENKKEDLLEIWDEQLSKYGYIIYKYRNEFVEKLQIKLETVHQEITEKKEKIKIEYISDCSNQEEFLKNIREKRKLDILKGFTTRGVHRDDFVIYINERPVNIYGSQGQHRTAMLSLKLSELQIIKDEINEYPILLLDDFMSELDSKRRKRFLESIKDIQVIITCTEKLELANLENFSYNVIDGKIIK